MVDTDKEAPGPEAAVPERDAEREPEREEREEHGLDRKTVDAVLAAVEAGDHDALVTLLDASGARPLIDRTLPMDQARDGFAAMAEGDVFGKIVFTR